MFIEYIFNMYDVRRSLEYFTLHPLNVLLFHTHVFINTHVDLYPYSRYQ